MVTTALDASGPAHSSLVTETQYSGVTTMFKPFDLTGKVALVTGGNGGIGLGMAEGLAAAGADVEIWGMNETKNAAAAETLKAYGKRVSARRVDVSKEDEVVAGMQAALKEMGRLDTVIANAGIGGSAPLTELTTELFHRVHAVNEDGVFWTFREAAKHMIERAKDGDAGGSLIAVASTAGIEGAARNAAYGASKGAVLSMVRALARRTGALRHSRQLDRAGLDRHRDDGRRPGEQDVQREGHRRACRCAAGASRQISAASRSIWRPTPRAYHTADTFVIDGGYTKF